MVITPGKNFDGQKGFPTPSDVPSDTACRSFLLPDDDEWLGLLMGAVELLLNPHNYFNYGALSIDDTVDHWQTIIQDAYDRSLLGTCAPMVEAPYWDTYADSDDESSVEDQPWYGELVPAASMRGRRVSLLDDDELTWRENLGIWAIAGFIAYSGQVGAAIAFVPFARRFVLKFRGNPLGAIAEIFVDGAKLATMDTASAEERIQAIDIQLPDDDEHEIWVAVGEDSPPGSTLQVVRKELDPAEVYPDNLRYNVDCDCVQQTYDDGDTWVDQPGQDPRHSTTYQFPPVTADDPRCQAASNMSLYFQNLIETVLNAISAGLDVLGVATAIMPVFVELGPFALFFDLGLGLSSALIGLGVDVISSEFTPEVFEALTCTFDCNIESDGTVTALDLAAINLALIADYNPDVYLILGACFLLMGEVGLSNAGTIGEAPADCDECNCGWCYEWDFTVSDGGFAPINIGGTDFAEYVAGVGWRCGLLQNDGCGGHAYLYMSKSLPSNDVIETVEYDLTTDLGGFDANVFNRLLGGSVIDSVPFDNGVDTLHTALMAGVEMDSCQIITNLCGQASKYVIEKTRFKGFGDMPAFTGGAICP